jgi:hypothetical protein
MSIQRRRAVYQHHSGTAPVHSIGDARAIDVCHACCCHHFSTTYMTTIIEDLVRVMQGGKSRHREAGA